uniref:Uncharacterized protein n=1 Tax=Craspedostauros australis TaxID=1486917 RepID=A0A6T6DL26_9STRA|mmetsp:Transcript_10931/g.30189  ORF Transcript_10931/g.30189 Transcript_10931/m.30189 type:complete len:400 (+) Transcript_10931:161-1360(+)
MVSFGKATLFLSIMSSVMDFTLGEETQVMMQKTRNLKGANGGSQSKDSKLGGFSSDETEVNTEAWRNRQTEWFYGELAQIQNKELLRQLEQFGAIDFSGVGATTAYTLTSVAGPDACVAGNPGIGRNGQFTEVCCDTLKKLIEFWSLDPAIDNTQLARIQMKGVKGQILTDTALLKAIFGQSPLVTDELIQRLQGGIQQGLPGGFDNPLLATVAIATGSLTDTGTIGGVITDATGQRFFLPSAVSSISIGDGLTDFLEGLDTIQPFLFETAVNSLFPPYLRSVVEPSSIPELLAQGGETPITQNLRRTEREVVRFMMVGYFVAHDKGTLFFDTFCDFLEYPRASRALSNCAIIVGANLAAMDGEDVKTTKLIEYAKANFIGIAGSDPSICPTPPGCFDD